MDQTMTKNEQISFLIEEVTEDIMKWCGLELEEREGIQDRLGFLVVQVEHIHGIETITGGLVESG